MRKKYFTLQEAHVLLPEAVKIVTEMMKIDKALKLVDSIDIDYDDDFEETANEVKRNKQYHKLSLDFFRKYEQLVKMGAIVKDLDVGLIDFYGKFEGRDIFLCYKLGENKIEHWHEITDGFAGRKPIRILEEHSQL